MSYFKGEKEINYGHGPRACLGRMYAREFLNTFFKTILKCKSIQFNPEKRHLYSGRNNDVGNIRDSFYQIKFIV